MHKLIRLLCVITLLFLLCFPLASCNEKSTVEPTYKELHLAEGNGTEDIQFGGYKAIMNARYGEHNRNEFDIFLADSEEKTPLLIFLYGGGFLFGDKNQKYKQDVQFCLDNGVSYAAINYPYMIDTPIHLTIFNVMYAIDYIIHYSDFYNVDKDRIAVYGVSSGAGCSLFIAGLSGLTNEQKIKYNIPEINIIAAGLRDTQATYDFYQWPDLLGMDNMDTLQAFISLKIDDKHTGDLLYGYPLGTIQDFMKPEIVEIRQLLDLHRNLTIYSPPIHIWTATKQGQFEILHSQNYSRAVYNRCKELGIESQFYYPEDEKDEVKFVDFLFEKLGKTERING